MLKALFEHWSESHAYKEKERIANMGNNNNNNIQWNTPYKGHLTARDTFLVPTLILYYVK